MSSPARPVGCDRGAGHLGWAALAQGSEHPRLHTNQAYVEEATRTTTLAIADPMAVFAFLLASLPDRVKVYPTENYYYFRFMHNGTAYAGNIRLDPLERDRGKVQFSYYPDLSEWRDKVEGDTYVVLDASRGVVVEQLERLVYRVSYGSRSVVFALNDLSQVRPPTGALGPDDKFLGAHLRRVRCPLLPRLQFKVENFPLHPRRNREGWPMT